MRYGITADELHDNIIKSMREFGRHMGYDIDDILDRHELHPLEQIISSVMFRVQGSDARKKAKKDEGENAS